MLFTQSLQRISKSEICLETKFSWKDLNVDFLARDPCRESFLPGTFSKVRRVVSSKTCLPENANKLFSNLLLPANFSARILPSEWNSVEILFWGISCGNFFPWNLSCEKTAMWDHGCVKNYMSQNLCLVLAEWFRFFQEEIFLWGKVCIAKQINKSFTFQNEVILLQMSPSKTRLGMLKASSASMLRLPTEADESGGSDGKIQVVKSCQISQYKQGNLKRQYPVKGSLLNLFRSRLRKERVSTENLSKALTSLVLCMYMYIYIYIYIYTYASIHT